MTSSTETGDVTGSASEDAYAFRAKLPWPVWALYRAVRVPAVASAFAGFWLGGFLLAWSVLPIVAFVTLAESDPHARTARCQRLLAASFRVFHGYMRVLRLVDARVEPLPPRAPNDARGRVLVANHTTLVDMTALVASYPRVCTVAKDSIARSPFVGRLLRLCGFIAAGRDMLERGASIDHAVRMLEAGFDVLVFPEGTRSPPGSMHPFQRGAFEIAKRADVPVVPIVMTCEPSALTKGRPFWRHPDRCAVLTARPGEPISVTSFKNSRSLRAGVESMYRKWLGIASRS